MSRNSLVRKITTGYQITIPTDFRKHNNLDIGSMVSVIDRDKLVIEPFKNKSEALKRLDLLFKDTPEDFDSTSEQKLHDIVRNEIKALRAINYQVQINPCSIN